MSVKYSKIYVAYMLKMKKVILTLTEVEFGTFLSVDFCLNFMSPFTIVTSVNFF